MEYENNIKRWAQFCPEAAERLMQMEGRDSALKIIESNSEPVNLKVVINDQECTFHDQNDPVQEANNIIAELDFEDCELLYVYGIGLGYLYEALKEWLLDPRHSLVFLEDDLEVIDAFMHTKRAAEILAHKQVWLYFLYRDFKGFDHFVNLFVMDRPKVIALPHYNNFNLLRLQEIKVQLSFIKNVQHAQANEYRSFGSGFFLNYFHNLFAWPKAYIGDQLFGKFPSVPAIICGAGPSLAKNIDLLRTLTDKALIFAGGTAMNVVNAKGIIPHFGIGIDPNFEQSTRIIMNKAFDTPFFYRSRIHHDALKMVTGDLLYLSGNSGYVIADHFDKMAGIEATDLEEGCNVINFSLAVAEKMGCNPIILVGVDLAYSDDKSYADGVLNHPIHAGKKLFRTKEHSEELVNYTDINGEPVFTLWKWITESLWFSHFALNHQNIKMINSTEGGIGFSTVENMPLELAAEKFLTRKYDFNARIFGEVQNSFMPAQVTDEYLLDALMTFDKSLEKAMSLLEERINILIKDNFQNAAPPAELEGMTTVAQSSETADRDEAADAALKEEIAYRFLLGKFEESFNLLHRREFLRLDLDAASYTPEELEKKRIQFHIQRLINLGQAASVAHQLIERVLARKSIEPSHSPSAADIKAAALEEKREGAVYMFNDGSLALIDPELNLNYTESFNPAPEDRHCLYYEDGTVKYECYLRNGVLHGPSRFYSPEKKLLVQNWYIDGDLQGKSVQHFSSGELYGVQSYCNGKRHGKQLRFFKNGCMRSQFFYKEGCLDGEATFNYENGEIARSLNFIDGKRNGIERIWNSRGQLIVEAQFKEDLPIGMARLWYENGVLAQETHYSDTAELLQVKRWDAAGQELNENQWQQLDYFEDVAKQTGVLTDNLSNIFEQAGQVMQAIKAETGSKTKDELEMESIANDFAVLKHEMDKLQAIQREMLFESGLDDKNPNEPIWKTPSIQREFQKKLDGMTKELHEGVSKLQSSLGHAVEELKKTHQSKNENDK